MTGFPEASPGILPGRRLHDKGIHLIIQLLADQALLFLCIFNFISIADDQMNIPDLRCLLKTVNKRIPFFIAGFFNDDRHPLLRLFIRKNQMHAKQQHYEETDFRQ